jgi:integrase/recombinase XerC
MKISSRPDLKQRLETALGSKIGVDLFDVPLEEDPDVLSGLLEDKRSEHTKRAYQYDIKDFFRRMADSEPTQGLIQEFLRLEQFDAVRVVLKYKAKLIRAGLAEATVNRRLSALKTLAKYGRKLGCCSFSLDDVESEKVRAYRDTTGVDPEAMRRVIEVCALTTLKGQRDFALLLILWENALRREEVALLNYVDFNFSAKTCSILGKGRGSKRESIDISPKLASAMQEWINASKGKRSKNEAIFYALDRAKPGHRLTGEGIRKIVRDLFKRAGISKPMSPHRVRHSSITAALDATDGNLRKVQKLSRHKNINTLTIYDDNRLGVQKEISNLLSDLL